MIEAHDPSRRDLLRGGFPEVHISSAIISVLPAYLAEVIRLLSEMTGVELHHQSASKLVIVLEGPDSGSIGARLTDIASLEGVLAANMVFEQIETLGDLGEPT